MKRFFILATAAFLTACNLDVGQPEDHPTDPATETFDPSLKVDIASMTKTPTGAYYKDMKIGDGAVLTGQPLVTFTFAGFVKSGATFGSGVQTVPLSLTQLVYGLQEGMQGMKVHGQRLIVVPSELGFGPVVTNGVPANSTLIFLMQLDDLPQ